ncbi:LysR family transcriptional regulator [Caulobacter sp. 1776]|uniref:LysR family transcriptional regulator n=1 Tax=Caulobacter sp. 1776 TaxID=3156420 RepID=UPI003394DAA0
MRHADLRRAAVFHAVAAAGGIAAASPRLGKSPPAIHHDLKRFEAEIGRPLFERAGRALRLTPAGQALFESVGRALDELERTRWRLSQEDPTLRPLRIATVSAFGRYRLAPALLAGLPADRPLELTFGTHEAVLAAVSSGAADLGVTYRPVTAAPVQSRPLAQEEIVLAVAKQARAPENLDVITATAFATYDEYEFVFGHWFETVFGRQPDSLRRLDHTGEIEEAMESCAAGRGAIIAPLDLVAAPSWRERVRVIRPLGLPLCVNTLHLLGLGAALASADADMIRSALGDSARPEGTGR